MCEPLPEGFCCQFCRQDMIIKATFVKYRWWDFLPSYHNKVNISLTPNSSHFSFSGKDYDSLVLTCQNLKPNLPVKRNCFQNLLVTNPLGNFILLSTVQTKSTDLFSYSEQLWIRRRGLLIRLLGSLFMHTTVMRSKCAGMKLILCLRTREAD